METIYEAMSHEDLVRQLLAVAHTGDSLEGYWGDFTATFLEFLGVRIDKEIVWKIARDLQREMPSVIDVAIPIYTKHFSPQELITLIEFCSSPVIAKMNNIRPQLKLEVSTSMGYLVRPETLTGVLDKHLGAGKW